MIKTKKQIGMMFAHEIDTKNTVEYGLSLNLIERLLVRSLIKFFDFLTTDANTYESNSFESLEMLLS